MEPLYNEVSLAHPVKTFFSAQAVLAAVFATSGLTAGAQSKSSDETRAASVTAADSVPVAVDPHTYQIGAEDVLFIRVWREPDFTFPVAVRPDGKITVPLVGEVQAAGENPAQLADRLKELLSEYLKNPDVSVFVTEVRSKRFYIDGEMYRPGWFPLVTR